MKRIIIKGIIYVKNLRYLFYRPEKAQLVYKKIPYFAQWESKDLVDAIFDKNLSPEDDPLWHRSGATTKEEYSLWSLNSCGVACLQMIIAYKTGKKVPLIALGKKCLEYGGYIFDKNAYDKKDYEHALPGLFYVPFIQFIKNEFQLVGQIVSPMILMEIVEHLSRNNLVIASVDSSIRDTFKPLRKRGHLVLVFGYNIENKYFIIHNSAGMCKKTQEAVKITFDEFERVFNHRGIAISLE